MICSISDRGKNTVTLGGRPFFRIHRSKLYQIIYYLLTCSLAQTGDLGLRQDTLWQTVPAPEWRKKSASLMRVNVITSCLSVYKFPVPLGPPVLIAILSIPYSSPPQWLASGTLATKQKQPVMPIMGGLGYEGKGGPPRFRAPMRQVGKEDSSVGKKGGRICVDGEKPLYIRFFMLLLP